MLILAEGMQDSFETDGGMSEGMYGIVFFHTQLVSRSLSYKAWSSFKFTFFPLARMCQLIIKLKLFMKLNNISQRNAGITSWDRDEDPVWDGMAGWNQ